MRTALRLARQQLGQTWPNPSVGAVLVKNGDVIGQAATAKGGRPHAETQAIEQAGENARGATLYVTLEPCSHQGKTGPCADAVIKAGITQVVVACGDPNPKVGGQGIAKLRAAGIEVLEGVCEDEAREINRGFFSVITQKRPFISLKIATSLDGKIATSNGQSQWITSQTAREYGHMLRSQYDAVATGIGTVLKDDPMLTCRLPGLENKSPVRVVFDSSLRLPATSQLARSAKEVPVWCIHNESSKNSDLESSGVTLLPYAAQGRTSLENAVALLAEQGITRLLIEAGAELSSAFLQSGLVDRMYWFRAPLVIGNDGLAAFNGSITQTLSDARRFQVKDHIVLNPDRLDILECLPAS